METGESPDNVGPGSYQIGKSMKARRLRMGKAGISFGCSRSALYGDVPKDNPGPGYYGMTTGPGIHGGVFSRIGRDSLWHTTETPSPGQYEPHLQEVVERNVKLRIGNPAFLTKEIRDPLATNTVSPGPAAHPGYLPGKESIGQFSRSVRFTAKNFCGPMAMNDSPAPDTYGYAGPEEIRASGGYIPIGRRFPKFKKSLIPGPGQYQETDKCELIHPSFNVNFDPEQQVIKKFGLD
jgi:hypothetical protein